MWKIDFEKGNPTAIDCKKMSPALLDHLNIIAGRMASIAVGISFFKINFHIGRFIRRGLGRFSQGQKYLPALPPKCLPGFLPRAKYAKVTIEL